MLWMITKDFINERVCMTLDEPIVLCIGRSGNGNVPPDERAAILAQCTDEFQLLNDDGEVYYEGACKDLADQSEVGAFQPLNWAMRRDGCTTMKYRKKGEKEWMIL